MADQNQCTLVALQGHLHGIAHVQVKVVGRFVQYQQVGPLPDHQRQRQAGFLAAGKRCDGLGGEIAAEVEASQKIQDFLLPGLRAQALDMQDSAGTQVQGLQLLLVKIADPAVLTRRAAACQQRQLANQAFQQGGFAGAVLAQQADAGTGAQHEADVAQNRRTRIAQGCFIQPQQGIAALARWWEHEIERRIHVCRSQLLHALKFLDPALGLARLGGLVAEAAHEILNVRDSHLLFFKTRLLIGQHLGPQTFVVGVVAFPGLQLAAFNAENAFAGGVNEVPVVGDHQQGARVAL